MAEVFVWPGGGALKLLRSRGAVVAMQRELASMRAAEATGVPMARLLGTVMVEGRPGILMERLDGIDQLTLLGRRPWIVWKAGTWLGRLHAQLHSVDAGANLRPLKQALQEAVEASKLIPEELKPSVVDTLIGLPDGRFVCHGDFHPGNVIETADGPRIIDWESATCGDRLADVARTVLLLRSGELPPGVSLPLRASLSAARKILAVAYLREYRRLRPFERRDLDDWEVIAAASRLLDGIAGEREGLLRVLRRSAAGSTATTPSGTPSE